MFHKLGRWMLFLGIIGIVVLALWPFHDGVLRYGLPLALIGTWILALSYLWRRMVCRVVLFVLPVLLLMPFCLPAKPIDPGTLRNRYVSAMAEREGMKYIWGGEGRWGIDCSGLPRRALRDSLLENGWRNRNGAAFRELARQWWFDTSAKAMGEGYRGFTLPVGIAGKIRAFNPADLTAGDLAVTADGRHVMIYLGGGTWIQADPGPGKVVISKPSEDSNPYFDAFVTMHRWTILDSEG